MPTGLAAEGELITHRPERRAVVRLAGGPDSAPGGPDGTRYAKVQPPERTPASGILVPRVLAQDVKRGVLVVSALGDRRCGTC